MFICNHRDLAPGQRQINGLPDQVLITAVLRIDCHCAIAEQGFRAGGGHNQMAIVIAQGITDMP